jgi:hypothetical protein
MHLSTYASMHLDDNTNPSDVITQIERIYSLDIGTINKQMQVEVIFPPIVNGLLLGIYLSMWYLSMCLSIIYLSIIYLIIYLSIYLIIYLSIYIYIYIGTDVNIDLSIVKLCSNYVVSI